MAQYNIIILSLLSLSTTLAIFSFIPATGSSMAISQEDLICPQGSTYSCYTKVFVPTEEFKPILPGQEIPPGLHVRMNLETGIKEAKLYSKDSTKDSPTSSEDLVVISDSSDQIESTIQTTPKVFKTKERNQIDESLVNSTILQNDHMPHSALAMWIDKISHLLNLHNQQQQQHHHHNLEFTVQGRQDHYHRNLEEQYTEIENNLDLLEDSTHDIKYGRDLIALPNGISVLMECMSHGRPSIRWRAALVLGNALQNNPGAQKDVLLADTNIYAKLKGFLLSEHHEITKSRIMYAFSSLVRGDNTATSHLLKSGDLLDMATLFDKSTKNLNLAEKLLSFVTDIMNPAMESLNKANEIHNVPFLEIIGLNEWCTIFENVIMKSPSTSLQSIGMEGLRVVLERQSCPLTVTFKEWVLNRWDIDETLKEDLKFLESHI